VGKQEVQPAIVGLRETITVAVGTFLVLFAIGAVRAGLDEPTWHRAEAEATCLEEIARHAEVRDNGYSLGTALGATGELPPVYGEQWVPMIGVLVPRPEREVPVDADARARALEACIARRQPNR